MHQDLNFGSSFENSLLEKQGNFVAMRACVTVSASETGLWKGDPEEMVTV